MPKDDRPNILLIMSDQHSKRYLGCYGNELVRTPSLDRLAAEGMRFDDAYCPAPLCVPSRMSFMTSRRPGRNRVWHNGHVLHSGIPTWAHVLGAAGYETSLLGRMHFVGPDQRHGFENRPIGEFGAAHPGGPRLGGPMWKNIPAITTGQARDAVVHAGRGPTWYQWSDEQVTATALKYLRERADGPIRPFAAVMGFLLPHCPFVAPKDLFDYYYDLVGVPDVEEDQPATITRFREVRGIGGLSLTAEQVRVARAAYLGMCEHMDRLIGQVLTCLDETGLADNTLVIYTSDHGEMAGEHGCWWKSNYYEGSVGIPLIARLGGSVPAGATCDAVCNLIDVGPTFADIAGAEFKPVPDGRSMWPLLQGQGRDDWTDETISEFVDNGGRVGPSRMIRSGPWKLWTYAFGGADYPPALFNLQDDPEELHDLNDDPKYAAIRDELLAKVHDGWNPETVLAESDELYESLGTLRAWGAAVQPSHPDTLTMPPADFTDTVELL